MSVLSAQSIRRLCLDVAAPLIWPWSERSNSNGRTYGIGPASYDLRLKYTLWMIPFFRSHAIASTIETLNLPDNVCGSVMDKSTNARLWVFMQNTHVDPGFRGGLTLEVTYEGWIPRRIRAGTPIAQMKFEWLDEATEQPYRGKYFNQSSDPQRAILESRERRIGTYHLLWGEDVTDSDKAGGAASR